MDAEKIYRVPSNKRIVMLVMGVVGSFIGGLLTGRISLAACIGIGVGIYLVSDQKVSLFSDRVSVKVLLNKPKNYMFSEGSFSLEEISGFKAYFLALKSPSKALYFTDKASGKKIPVSYMLSEGDFAELFAKLPS